MNATSRQQRYSNRPIDILVHGATGFTGQRVVKHLLAKHPELNVAICGRSRDKLIALDLGWDESKCESSIFVVSNVVEESEKLVETFSKAKIVIACAGMYVYTEGGC